MNEQQTQGTENWFETWFDSPYYNILYQHRDNKEAYFFIDNLINFLQPKLGAKMLDLACGKGRHAIFLADKGFNVVGVDLAEERIREARAHERENLHYYRHDMRESLNICDFDYTFNFFTSFGYFDTEKEHYETVQHVADCLRKGGRFVVDFMNVQRVLKNLRKEDHIKEEGIDFYITRSLEDGQIVKDIRVQENEQEHHFEERVRALTLEDFRKYLEAADMKITNLMGNYALEEYIPESSDRLIIIAEKQ